MVMRPSDEDISHAYRTLRSAMAQARIDAENLKLIGLIYADLWAKALTPNDRLFLRIQGIDPR